MDKLRNKNPKVCIIILNWNGLKDTEECLDSVLKINYDNKEIVVVDNNSEDGSVDFFRKKYSKNIKLICNSENLGYGGGLNEGIKYSINKNFDYTLTMNNDLIVDINFVIKLVEVFKNFEDVGIVTGKSYYYGSNKILQRVGRKKSRFFLAGGHVGLGEEDTGQYNDIKEYDFVDDVFWLLSNDAIKEVGMYDSANFFFMAEEMDYCLRMRNKGFKIYYTPKSKVWHKVNASLGGRVYSNKLKNPQKSKSNLTHYMFAQSQNIIFYRKHLPFFHLLSYLTYNTFFHLPFVSFKLLKNKDFSRLKSLLIGYKRGILWELK